MHHLPIIDLSERNTTAGQQKIAQELVATYSTLGFAIIINHGVAPNLIDDLLSTSKAFHALPLNEKMTLKQNHSACGYVPINSYSLKKTGIGESTETTNQNASIGIGTEIDSDAYHQPGLTVKQNQWPTSLPNMKAITLDYVDQLTLLSQHLLRMFAQGLSLPVNCFDPWLQPTPITNLRLLHFPQRDTNHNNDQYGLAPHSDYGLLTLVAQDGISGLQVRTPCGTDWIEVEPIPGSLVLNTADSLTRLTNGRLLSTPHRVINPTHKERYSAAFFLSPSLDVSLKPLDACCHDQPPKFDDITYRTYINDILAQNYGRGSKK